ncbi:MAG: A/G-specific adenine glycosylase [Pararhodobacter sp.]
MRDNGAPAPLPHPDALTAIAPALLAWYDGHARDLPWRVGPAARAAGHRADPYRVWLSEVMLQQTTVATVRDRFVRFVTRWPDISALARAPDADVMAEWAGLGYYARARNLLACARQVAASGGGFPEQAETLRALPGIGAYTAAAIAAIAFDRAETVVDGNVERVVARLFALRDPLPGVKRQIRDRAALLTPRNRPGDYAQAMMDLGATLCSPRAPRCPECPLSRHCAAHAQGIAATLPARAPRRPKPQRHGVVYVAQRLDGAVLLETRPPTGLLGGMPGWPGTDWRDDRPAPAPPVKADWQPARGVVTHVFTHFHLRLDVMVARPQLDAEPCRGRFVPDFDPGALPTVMRKCWDVAQDALDDLDSRNNTGTTE